MSGRDEERKRDGHTDASLLRYSTPRGSDTAAEEADTVQRSRGIDLDNGDVCEDCVLREGRGSHLQNSVSGPVAVGRQRRTKWKISLPLHLKRTVPSGI